MKRKLPDILTAYLEYVDNTEPPLLFHIWTIISCLSGTLQRRVYIRVGHETILPHQYIILVAPSGAARKGTAINIGRSFVEDIGLHLTGEDPTPESIIRKLREINEQ